VSGDVGLDLAQAHLLVRERTGTVAFEIEVVRIRFVQEHLHRNVQLPAVVQHRFMRIRDAPRPDVDVLPLVKCAHLPLTADFGMLVALLDRPLQAADAIARFEQLVVVAELAELVAHDHARESAAKHQHLRLRGTSRQLRLLPRRSRHEIQRGHGAEHERRSADGAELLQEAATGQDRRAE
jgi:hypothetical protein